MDGKWIPFPPDSPPAPGGPAACGLPAPVGASRWSWIRRVTRSEWEFNMKTMGKPPENHGKP